MTKREEWSPIPEWEGLYWISTFGRVRSSGRWVNNLLTGGLSHRKGRILRPSTSGVGYPHVWLSRDGVKTRLQIHRCVVEVFVGDLPTEKHQVNHKDGNKTNNHAENLEWMTPYENIHHARETGLHEKKLELKDLASIHGLLRRGFTQKEIARFFGVSPSMISRIKGGQRWVRS